MNYKQTVTKDWLLKNYLGRLSAVATVERAYDKTDSTAESVAFNLAEEAPSWLDEPKGDIAFVESWLENVPDAYGDFFMLDTAEKRAITGLLEAGAEFDNHFTGGNPR